MARKSYCEQCGTKHELGKCPMAGQSKNGKKPSKQQKVPDRSAGVDQSTCPHDKHWKWTAYYSTGKTFHERWKYCGRCHFDPRVRDLSKHRWSRAVCSDCNATRLEG